MNFRTPILYGFMVALTGTLLMFSLLGLGLLGPNAVSSEKEMIGGTILFLMLYLFLLFGIYFVLKQKKKQGEGTLHLKTAIIQGMITSLSCALFSVLFTYLFYEVLYPEYASELVQAIKEKMELGNISKDKIEAKLVERRAYFSTGNQSLYSFLGNFMSGATFTLLLGFFLKTKRK